ncbi:MAG: hypothetical protein JXO22_08150, partial [Phycisphaerae bacterium]|nr:hypothetical protein [Phycisphaerae bacterium]
SDYTPWWADRDNNHAWQVVLDENGNGHAGLSNRAAKVYRKTYSIQRDSLGFIKHDDEQVPRWLSGTNYVDVTAQYRETSDVTIELGDDRPAGRFAYVCVFNGGEWRPIHWGEIARDRVTFTNLGRDIAYLPAYYVDEEVVPAAPPFILARDGEVLPLIPDGASPLTIELRGTVPETPDADTRVSRPAIDVKLGQAYELFVWEDGWRSLGKLVAIEQSVFFEIVPGGGLYWLVEDGSRRLERIFTIDGNKQSFW